MARKSKQQFKGFGEPPKARAPRLSKQERQELDALEQKLLEGSLAGRYSKVVRNPKGQAKMSEVLEAFVQPYMRSLKTHKQRATLLETGAFAWNTALLPEEQQSQAIEEMLEKICAGQPALHKQTLLETVEEMIVRKRALFDEHKRSIVDFSIQETADGYHIAVMSAPMG